LLTIAALRAVEAQGRIVAWAKYPHQQEQAHRLGADEVVPVGKGAYEDLCRLSGATLHFPDIGSPTVLGGFDLVFDCVGSPRSLDDSIRFTRARGTTILVGMPAIPRTVDWTTIWFKELEVKGAYAYGLEEVAGEQRQTFELALWHLGQKTTDLASLVTHRFSLADYREAIRTALLTGRHRSVKTVFDFTGGQTP
jgi:threonine dehydrogenase-like Zn-dependent dehydrogenase